MKLTANRIAGILRKNGLKLTPQRRAVLRAVAESRDHLTPSEIHRKARKIKSGIGLVSIYRTLNILSELGLLCQVHAENGCRNYLMRRPEGHHHHVVCSGCGRVADDVNCNLGKMEKKLSSETGFEIEGHLLEFYGHCPDCLSRTGSGTT